MLDDDAPAQLPTGLWVEVECAKLNARGIGYYIARRGNYGSGVILVKIYHIHERSCILYEQQRDLDGRLGWVRALGDAAVAEGVADQAIEGRVRFDPDLWLIEIEADSFDNPFDFDGSYC